MFTHGEKMILLSAIALDATVTKEQTKCASLVLRKIAEERLRILATLTDKVMADVTPTIPGYFTRDGRMVEFFRDNPDKSDYCRLKVWRLLPGREEIYTSPEGQMDTADPNYLANGHPLDIMLPQVAQVAR